MKHDIHAVLPIALKLIGDQNKLKDIQPAGWVADHVPSTDEVIYRVSAVEKGKPNGPIHSIVIDEQGKPVDLKALSAQEKVDFFPPFPRSEKAKALNPAVAITSFAAPASLTVPVTITPNVNDLHLAGGESFDEEIHVTVPRVPDPLFDVYFLADTTGSMGGIIKAVQLDALNILNTFIGGPAPVKFPNMAFGVGNYKDFQKTQIDPYCFQHQLSPTTNIVGVQNAINAWEADGGVDGPEGQLFALDQIATNSVIGWRPGAKRIVVWFGDAPGHDPICAGLPGVPTAITEKVVIDHLIGGAGGVIRVLAIKTNTGYPLGLDDDATPTATDYPCPNTGLAGQATRIAEKTGGSVTLGVVDATEICGKIIEMVMAATNLFNSIKLVPAGATAPFVTSITPIAGGVVPITPDGGGYGPIDNKGHDLVFKVVFTAPPCTDTDQASTGTIDVVADEKVVAQKKVALSVIACERWSYGVKFLCGYLKEGKSAATLRPGIYSTEVNILNYHATPVTIRKYLYPLMLEMKPIGREPRYVERKAEDVITLPGKSATFDDCVRLHQILSEDEGNGLLSICYLEIVSPVELTVTAVYTANDAHGATAALDVVQVEGKPIGRCL